MVGSLSLNLQTTGFIIIVVLAVFAIFYYVIKLRSNASNPQENNIQSISSNNMPSIEMTKKEDELEIAAVIAAAISAYTGVSSTSLNIKSIKRVEGNNSPWRMSGINRY